MYNDPAAWDRINSFALVSYIPEPLAGFLDRLRQELVPNCFLRAHVTILPPRPISSSKPEAAWETVRTLAPRFAPFDVEMTQLEVFPVSDVIHIGIGRGREEMERCTHALNVDGLKFTEPYPYHPHITLAQDLKGDEVDELARVARARWAE
jgi:2'-5' RNA ligase